MKQLIKKYNNDFYDSVTSLKENYFKLQKEVLVKYEDILKISITETSFDGVLNVLVKSYLPFKVMKASFFEQDNDKVILIDDVLGLKYLKTHELSQVFINGVFNFHENKSNFDLVNLSRLF